MGFLDLVGCSNVCGRFPHVNGSSRNSREYTLAQGERSEAVGSQYMHSRPVVNCVFEKFGHWVSPYGFTVASQALVCEVYD